MRPQIVAGCSGGPNMTSVPLTSKQCRFAEWSYLARGGEVPGSIPNHATFTSNLPPPPPYFVHVLVYAAANRPDLPFTLPHGPPAAARRRSAAEQPSRARGLTRRRSVGRPQRPPYPRPLIPRRRGSRQPSGVHLPPRQNLPRRIPAPMAIPLPVRR
jgi:hypothetical protein